MNACVHSVPRPYQLEGINKMYAAVVDANTALLYAPTGAGKTELAFFMVAEALAAGHKVLIVTDQITLNRQWTTRAAKVGIAANDVGVLRGEDTHNIDAPLILASAQTLDARKDTIATPEWLAGFKAVFIDECHVIREAHKRAVTAVTEAGGVAIGMSATPDARGLREIYGQLVVVTTIAELTPKYLVPSKVYVPSEANQMYLQALSEVRIRAGEYVQDDLSDAMSDPRLTASAVKVWQEHAAGKPTLVFCTSKAHADAVGKSFTGHGIDNAVITESTHVDERDAIIAEFEAGNIDVLISVNVLGTGFDCPRAEVGLMLRPTKSMMVWIQQCGRLLRPYEGKDHALLLDLAGNTLELCHPANYEPPKELLGKRDAKPKAEVSLTKLCTNCDAVIPRDADVCPECDTVLTQSADDQPGTGHKLVQMREIKADPRPADLPLQTVYLMFLHIVQERQIKVGTAYYKTLEFWQREHGYTPGGISTNWKHLPAIEPTKAIRNFYAESGRAYRRRRAEEQALDGKQKTFTKVDENGKTKINLRGW